jgi:hypothetical protein
MYIAKPNTGSKAIAIISLMVSVASVVFRVLRKLITGIAVDVRAPTDAMMIDAPSGQADDESERATRRKTSMALKDAPAPARPSSGKGSASGRNTSTADKKQSWESSKNLQVV